MWGQETQGSYSSKASFMFDVNLLTKMPLYSSANSTRWAQPRMFPPAQMTITAGRGQKT